MAKYKVKTKGCQLKVKAHLSFRENLDKRQFDSFLTKSIRGLLKGKQIKKRTIVYSGPVGVRLSERLKKPINRYDFFFLMEQIVDIVREMDKRGLIINNLIWDTKNIFINETTRELNFIYLPLEEIVERSDVLAFMENLIYVVQSEGENTEYMSRFIYAIKSLRSFDADKIEQFIAREEISVVNTIKSMCPMDEDMEKTGKLNEDLSTEKLNEELPTEKLNEELPTEKLNEDLCKLDQKVINFQISDGDYATLQLNEMNIYKSDVAEILNISINDNKRVQYASLERCSTKEYISINKQVFRIGTDKNSVDYFVANNDTVSRNHADINIRGNRYYIYDISSKNRTYVNGEMIPIRQEIEIFSGDLIKLANEEFRFYV